MNAINKYHQRVLRANSLVCVGLDSDYSRLPERFLASQTPQFEFNKWIIEQTHEYASAYKPNMAFYEARGDQGLRELKLTMKYLCGTYPDILTISDCKRADIGSTNIGYVASLFDWLGFDAVTLHPYLGREALEPFLRRDEKGCIILCRTSNPGAGELQDVLSDGKPLWHHVAEKVTGEWNEKGNCLMVVGATYPEEMKVVRAVAGDMTFLVPGVGAQGGDVKAAVQAGLNSRKAGLIINSSRGIIFSDDPAREARKLRDEINEYRR